MKMLIIITAIAGTLGVVGPAFAGASCSWVGDFWVCNDYSGGGSSTCSWVGDFWVCN
jgi:hypothetical protein